MKSLLLSLFALSSSLALAQATVQGVTLEYNGADQKTPLGRVALSVSGAASTMSDAQGNFTLQFRVLHDGDQILVRRIEKAGYEVFNTDAIEQWFISGKGPFQIVLCKTETLNDLRRRYRDAACMLAEARLKEAEEAEEKRRKQKLISRAELRMRLAELEAKHEEQLNRIETYADRFARIDLSTISADEQKVIDLVAQGRIDEAIRAYDGLRLLDRYKKERDIVNRQEAALQAVEDAIASHEAISDELREAIFRQIEVLHSADSTANKQKIEQLLNALSRADSMQHKSK